MMRAESSELVFVDELPPARPKHGRTADLVQQLRSRPGEWAMWPTKTTPSGVRKTLTPFCCEVASRTVDGKQRAFVRYVGEPTKPAAGPPPVPSRSTVAAAPDELPTTVHCQACGEVLAVDTPFGETERKRAMSAHRRKERDCDAILKRRGR